MKKGLTYKDSGVDIDQANRFVEGIGAMVKSTMIAGVLSRKGSFGGLFELGGKYKKPVLVSSTDGVGTKLLLAKSLNRHDTVGIDLVAMNVNDVLCTGARPLFFLDYIACGKVNPALLLEVMKGVSEGCRQAGCALVGGETAEMPGLYKPDEYDLAGFTVGVVDKKNILDGSKIRRGDIVIGLASSGLHSNGFSLARKVFSAKEQKLFAEDLLVPTRIYVKPVLAVLAKNRVHGIAHVTGGAFYEKMTKVLPKGLCFQIKRGSWTIPEIFKKIQDKGNIADAEMFRTFNMGIGMVLVVPPKNVDKVRETLKKQAVENFMIGEVIKHTSRKICFF
jgi:phosphoribosylformylglycinamidine cyclo-ligase